MFFILQCLYTIGFLVVSSHFHWGERRIKSLDWIKNSAGSYTTFYSLILKQVTTLQIILAVMLILPSHSSIPYSPKSPTWLMVSCTNRSVFPLPSQGVLRVSDWANTNKNLSTFWGWQKCPSHFLFWEKFEHIINHKSRYDQAPLRV